MATGKKTGWFAVVSLAVVGLILSGVGPRPAASQEKGARGLFLDPSSGAFIQSGAGSEKKAPQGKPAGKSQAAGSKREQKGSSIEGSNTGLRYKIEVVGKEGEIQWATSKRTFLSGERVRFHLETNVNGHFLIVHKDPSGKSTILFPDPRINNGDSYVEKGKDYIIPSGGGWFRFDQNPGKEELTVFLSQGRMEEMDKFKEKREMSAEESRSLYAKAEQARGGKGLYLEVAEAEVEKATYIANASHDPKALVSTTIILNHQ